MQRRQFMIGAAGLAAFTALGGTIGPAAADTLDQIRQRKKLLIAIDLGSPPFGMSDTAMRPTGSEVESANLLAQELGFPLEIVPVTGPNRIPFLLTGKADLVMASFSVSDERKKVIDFSDAYGVIQIIVAGPKGTAIKSFTDLVGKKIGTTRGTTNDKEVTTAAQGAEIVRFDDDATLITALVSGQVNILASSPQILAEVNPRRTSDPLELKLVVKTNPYAVGIRKGDDALRAAVNSWIAKDLASGRLRAIYQKYNGVPLPAELPKT